MKHVLAIALMLVFAAPASADPPRAVTGPAQVLAPLGVNGTGTINDAGQDATWWFEWSVPTYDYKTDVQQISASPDDQQVIQPLLPIWEATTYRYRLVLQMPDGPIYGDWVEFTTPAAPMIKGRPPIPRMLFSSRPLRLGRDHTLPVLIGCRPGATPCRGTIVVKNSDAPNARAFTERKRFSLEPGRWQRIRLGLTRAGRRLDGSDDGRLLSIDVRGADGQTSATRQLSAK